jgi:hypothetical protein
MGNIYYDRGILSKGSRGRGNGCMGIVKEAQEGRDRVVLGGRVCRSRGSNSTINKRDSLL